MRIFLALMLSFVTFSSLAEARDAVTKFTSYVPVGSYSGVDRDNGSRDCQVTVSEVNYPDNAISVRVVSGDSDVSKLIEAKSDFRSFDGLRKFLQDSKAIIGNDESSFELVSIFTAKAGLAGDDDNKQVVEISDLIQLNTETKKNDKASCVIDL